MAQEVNIAGQPMRARIRDPWAVLGLTIITFGIYNLFWWYEVNRELRDLGRAKGVSGLGEQPALSVLAATIGGVCTLYVTTVWTYVAGTKRAQHAQRLVGQPELNGWVMLLLAICTFGLGAIFYFQAELNKVWRTMPLRAPAPQVNTPPAQQANLTSFPAPTVPADLSGLPAATESSDLERFFKDQQRSK